VCNSNNGTELGKIMALTRDFNLANPKYGFEGDPSRPVPGKYFGYMIWGNRW
jgi:hypothetical protein